MVTNFPFEEGVEYHIKVVYDTQRLLLIVDGKPVQ